MSAEIVNLNKFRKAREKAAKQSQAAENRVQYGRTKAEKLSDGKTIQDAERHLDGRRLDGDDKDSSV